MSPTLHIALPLTDTLALLDATALFVIQLLIAQHPHLLLAPEEARRPPSTPHANLLLDRVRDLQYAIEIYRDCVRGNIPLSDDDGIPF